MQIDKTLHVFPTNRSLSERLRSTHSLMHAITIKEFFEKAEVCDGRIRTDAETRFLLLKEAIAQVDIQRIGFSKNFLEFLEHSSFIFRFFDELFSEKVSFEQLRRYDFYAAFDEHITILEKLYNTYMDILEQKGFYDPAFGTGLLLNRSYFSQFESIVFRASGYLTQKELDILQAVATHTPLTLHLRIDSYNANMLTKLANRGMQNLQQGELAIAMQTLEVSEQQPLQEQHATVSTYPFSQRLSQAVFVFALLHQLMQKTKPENIAIVVLDEGFATFLKDLDFHHNLNFAMGEKFADTTFFKNLKALLDSKKSALQELTGIAPLLELLEEAFAGEKDYDHIKETLFRFQTYQNILTHHSTAEIGALFLENIRHIKLDDVKGGRIKVIGLLEARELSPDTVIITDFNRGTFPKSSQKDLFLNSEIKKGCAIPIPKEREGLQMHYLNALLHNTKNVHLLYTHNHDALPSKFLDLLPHREKRVDETKMHEQFFGYKNYLQNNDDPIGSIDLSRPFSHSSFKTFLTCKRQYFYRYIAKIKEPQKDALALRIGDRFHDYMRQLGDTIPQSPDTLMQGLKKALLETSDSKTTLFNLELFLMECEVFCETEYQRRQEGFRPILFEEAFEVILHGIPFKGTIDRVDEKDGSLYIIDYKTGKRVKADSRQKLKNTVDFQLPIYRLGLEEKLGQEAETAYFFDIRSGKLIEEIFIKDKITLLEEKVALLKEPKITFSRTKKKSPCRYCDYKIICGRD